MNAGTVGLLDPVADPLETWLRDDADQLPALVVEAAQADLDGDAVQRGTAAGCVSDTETAVSVAPDGIDAKAIDTSREVATEWLADVTDAGYVVAESTFGSGDYPFPFDLFTARTGSYVERAAIDVEAVSRQWRSDDRLYDTWMVGSNPDGTGTSIDYNQAALPHKATEASIGLGFEAAYQGTVAKGVVYASGYLAIWEDWPTRQFATFVEGEILPHASTPEDDDDEQTTLGGDSA